MSVIHHEMEIDAAPEAVFDLMARMEAFAAYSEAIESITRVGPERYRWRVRVAGVPLVFDVDVLVVVPPRLLGWRALAGLSCEGCYRLTPSARGTHLELGVRCGDDNPLTYGLLGLAAHPLLDALGVEVVRNAWPCLHRA
ncbi:SRPBCC family protein [Thioalkalivibrio sp. ALMg9]|uniref:SRPBCC family protein n=1 Tax=Thioalkalivibrio sp. ALMg9 TaxID=1266912 RepID=UPI00036F7F72|nr:SRPBCC family protein [Thioalkalivibrio sp. ALMg9]